MSPCSSALSLAAVWAALIAIVTTLGSRGADEMLVCIESRVTNGIAYETTQLSIAHRGICADDIGCDLRVGVVWHGLI
jgi:hypothetical protein